MKREEYIRIIVGLLILITLILSRVHSPYWLLFTAFIGLNLLQSGFTKFCPMDIILEKVFKISK
jgi:hypothetical protein